MKLIAGLFGSAIGFAFFVLMIFSLPLNVIAIMRFMGWEWWTALLVAVGMHAIPVLGSLAYIVLAVIGAFFFVQAGFDWKEAIAARPATYNSADLSDEKFEQYKIAVVKPQFEKACLEQAKKNFGFEGKIPERAQAVCSCYASILMEHVPRQEMLKSSAPSVALQEKINSMARERCST